MSNQRWAIALLTEDLGSFINSEADGTGGSVAGVDVEQRGGTAGREITSNSVNAAATTTDGLNDQARSITTSSPNGVVDRDREIASTAVRLTEAPKRCSTTNDPS